MKDKKLNVLEGPCFCGASSRQTASETKKVRVLVCMFDFFILRGFARKDDASNFCSPCLGRFCPSLTECVEVRDASLFGNLDAKCETTAPHLQEPPPSTTAKTKLKYWAVSWFKRRRRKQQGPCTTTSDRGNYDKSRDYDHCSSLCVTMISTT